MVIKSIDNGTLNWNHESSKRNVSFDYLKGIGILLMMVCHLVGEHNRIVYSFHMPLFFLLAGYYAKAQYPPAEPFAVKEGCKKANIAIRGHDVNAEPMGNCASCFET